LTEIADVDKIIVYPNPALNGKFIIKGIDKIIQIELFDMFGKKVAEYNNLKQSSVSVNLSAKPGIYTIKLYYGQKAVYKKLLIIRN